MSDPPPPIPPSEALALVGEDAAGGELVGGGASAATPDPRLVYLGSLSTPKSRRAMAAALERVAAAVATLGGRRLSAAELPWHRLRYAHTSAIRAALIERYAPATVGQALAALRGVLREAARLGLLSAEDLARASALKPAKGTRLPKGRALSQAELHTLVEACKVDTAAGARDAALLALVYNCGLRRAEAVALDVADYDRPERRFRVRGKGDKERAAYVTAAAEALDRWLALRGEAPGPVFLPIDKAGRQGEQRLTDQAVLFILRRLGERAGVALFSPHDLRRTFIGDLLEGGADISTVQQMAGHAQVTTTQRYDRRGDKAKKKAAGLLKL